LPIRFFFAVIPDLETRQRIAAAAQALDLEPPSRPVPPENYHMTLAFVGEAPESQAAALRRIGGSQRVRRFDVRFDAYEYWQNSGVVVAAAREFPAELEQWWQQLHADLAQHHLALNPNPTRLRPHVTIARKVMQAPVLQAMSAVVWKMQSFSLLHSNSGAPQPIYTVVDTWPLLDETATP
jgi:2'-5' RNA ligase